MVRILAILPRALMAVSPGDLHLNVSSTQQYRIGPIQPAFSTRSHSQTLALYGTCYFNVHVHCIEC